MITIINVKIALVLLITLLIITAFYYHKKALEQVKLVETENDHDNHKNFSSAFGYISKAKVYGYPSMVLMNEPLTNKGDLLGLQIILMLLIILLMFKASSYHKKAREQIKDVVLKNIYCCNKNFLNAFVYINKARVYVNTSCVLMIFIACISLDGFT